MAQFWIAIFFILLAATQLYQSIKDINLPFPVYLVLGTVLAVAANSSHKFAFIPTQQVTLQEITTPDPVLTAQTSPVLTPVANDTAPLQIDAASEPQKPRARKTATDKDIALTPETEIKKSRPRKAAPKSPQASS